MSNEKVDQQESEMLTESYDTTVPPWLGPPKWLFPRMVYNYGEQEKNVSKVMENGNVPYQQFGRAFEKYMAECGAFRKYCNSFPEYTSTVPSNAGAKALKDCFSKQIELLEKRIAFDLVRPAKCKYDGSKVLVEIDIGDRWVSLTNGREGRAADAWNRQRKIEASEILRRRVQRKYREWPICKVTGNAVELRFRLMKWLMFQAIFICPDCHGEKT